MFVCLCVGLFFATVLGVMLGITFSATIGTSNQDELLNPYEYSFFVSW